MEKTLQFEFDKETPGTFRFKEIVPEDEEVSVPTIYIRKTFFENERPDKLQITINLPDKQTDGK